MRNFKVGRLWGVLGKQQSYSGPTPPTGNKVPLNNNPMNSWDYKKSNYRRLDGRANAIQQGGAVPQDTPTPSPTPTPVQWVAGGSFETGYSYDATTWSAITLANLTYYVANDIVPNGSRWVSTGVGYQPDFTGNTAISTYSDDGKIWYSGTSFRNLYGASSVTALSTNGTLWVAGISLTYDNIITNGRRAVTYSYDGINWSACTITPSSGRVQPSSINDITYGNGIFVGVGSSTGTTTTSTRILISNDGISWSGVNYNSVGSILSVSYGNGVFVAAQTTNSLSKIIVSNDGLNWSASTNATNASLYGTSTSSPGTIRYFNGKFLGTFGSLSTIPTMTYSTDGFIWSASTSADAIMNTARWQANNGSNQAIIVGQTTGSTAGVYSTSDGVNYSQIVGNVNTIFTGSSMTCVSYKNPTY